MAQKRDTKQKLFIAISVAVVLGLLVLFAFWGDNFMILKSLFTTKNLSNQELRDLLESFGWRGYITSAVLSTLQVVCAFLPAEPVQVLSGFTFGFFPALLCCMAGVIIGNTLIFMLHKTFGDGLQSFFIKKLNLDLEKISRSSKCVLIIFILYFLPAIPYGMICFFAASIGMSYKRFIIVTGLGSLPSVCIGVGLGYMTIVSDATVSICVFALLVLLLIIMFWKKNLLFSRLNDYADKHKKNQKFKVQNVDGFVMNLVFTVVKAYFSLCGIKSKTTNNIGKPESPSIILCNHGSFIDFIYAGALLKNFKPNFIAARLYFYDKRLKWLLKTLGAFPKSMFATDIENVKNCLTVLKEKNHLAMMPEARLSTTGRFEDIQENTYSFIKKAGVSVYTVKIGGNYLADPKWGKGFRKGSLVEAELDVLYTASEINRLSVEEIKRGIEERLGYDEFEWLAQHPDIHYRSRRIAEGLENILAVCPLCKQKHTITTKGNQVFCEKCGLLTAVDDRYNFDEGFKFKNHAEWYDWQKALLEKEILGDENYALSSEVELRLPSDGKGLTRYAGNGICRLNRDGLTYVGTKDGKQVELAFPLSRIYRLLFGAGQNFEIYDGTQIQFFVPIDKRSAVDWYMTSMILHDEMHKGDLYYAGS